MGRQSDARAGTKTVIVIDDESAILDAVQIILTQEGYTAVTYSSLPSLDELEAASPHVVLLDLRLGADDGAPYCLELKSSPHLQHIPVILLSAHAESDVEKKAKECKANGHLAKPFDITALLEVIHTHALD
jgi:DNA-binding response OmpR family regulator